MDRVDVEHFISVTHNNITMDEKTHVGFQTLLKYAKVVAIAALGTYLAPAIVYITRHFSDFAKLEANTIKYIGSIVTQAGRVGLGGAPREALAGVTILVPAALLGIVLIFFCVWIIYQIIVKQEKWVKEFHEAWQEVGKCHWWDSIWDFFKCLGGVLYALVYTVVWVLQIIFSILVVLVNIAGVIAVFA